MNVQAIYDGSDGEATKALYARLATLGPVGEIAINLFRAQKASARAKVYRGGVRGMGSFRGMAYDRKNWSMAQLDAALSRHAAALAIPFGWGEDAVTPGFPWVLYVDLPTGQVSFHARTRGAGPDYAGNWDGIRDASPDRIVRWCHTLLIDGPPKFVADVAPPERAPAPRWLWCRECCAFWANRSTCPMHPKLQLEVKDLPATLPELRPGARSGTTRSRSDEETTWTSLRRCRGS